MNGLLHPIPPLGPFEKWGIDLMGPFVATPLWGKCEVATHIPENGTCESPRTFKNLEHDCKGQNTSH
jgi:hypothetical protein